MFAFFDDDVFGPEFMDFFECVEDVGFFGEEVGFAIVENEGVDAFQEFEEISEGDVEPEVHGIHDDEFGTTHLVEDVVLE